MTRAAGWRSARGKSGPPPSARFCFCAIGPIILFRIQRGGVTMGGSRSLIAGLTIAGAVALAGPAAADNVLRWASVGGALTADPHAYGGSGP
jgi:hypothetical protein